MIQYDVPRAGVKTAGYFVRTFALTDVPSASRTVTT
jgi:hypothetical protein